MLEKINMGKRGSKSEEKTVNLSCFATYSSLSNL